MNLRLIDRDDACVTAPQLAEQAGITYRQMDYWTRTDLLESLPASRSGIGYPRVYPADQVRRAVVVRSLLEGGLTLQVVREIIDELLATGTLTRGPITININEEES